MRDLIIGMGDDTDQGRDKTFLRSIERLNIDAEVHLFHHDPLPWHPVVDRWKLIADYIAKAHHNYRYVIACDTFDVVFQSNPFEWLEKNLKIHDLVVVSEERTFAECEGNKRGILQSYPHLYEQMKGMEICNAGIVAGKAINLQMICSDIYNWCQQDVRLSKFTPGFDDRLPDQQCLNILIHNAYVPLIVHGKDAFAFQYNHKHEFRDGRMFNENGQLYAILHQYLYQWGNEVRNRYLT